MRGAPGSAGWLLWHELRLAWHGAAAGKPGLARRGPGATAIGLLLLGWSAVHLLGWVTVRKLSGAAADDPRVLLAVSAALAAATTFMLSSAIKSSVLALFERGDLDLLLSSPLPSSSIFTVRLAGVSATTAALYLFFLAPFAHAGLLQGQWRWLGLYPAVIAIAVLCACAAMLLTLGLVRVLGARRTRVVAQVIGALAGALLVIASQLQSLWSGRAPGGIRAVAEHWLRQGGMPAGDSMLWLPARAVLGEPLPVLALGALACAVFVLTARLAHRFFAHGLQQVASSGRAAAHGGSAARMHFGRSLFDTVVVKEWRLIVRDPHLLSQVLLQLLYLLPLCVLIFRGVDVQLQAIGAALTLLCGSLTGALAWIALSAEDAPDLLLSSPAGAHVVRRAKLAAAVMPVLLLAAAPLLWLLAWAPVSGLIACFTASGVVLSAGLIVFWCGRPGQRSDFKGRGKGGLAMNLLELGNNLGWGTLAWLLGAAPSAPLSDLAAIGIAGCVALLAGVFLSAWWMRRQPH